MRPSTCTAPCAPSAGRENLARPFDFGRGGQKGVADDRDLARMNHELGAEAEGALEREVGAQLLLVVDGGRHARDGRRRCPRSARR